MLEPKIKRNIAVYLWDKTRYAIHYLDNGFLPSTQCFSNPFSPTFWGVVLTWWGIHSNFPCQKNCFNWSFWHHMASTFRCRSQWFLVIHVHSSAAGIVFHFVHLQTDFAMISSQLCEMQSVTFKAPTHRPDSNQQPTAFIWPLHCLSSDPFGTKVALKDTASTAASYTVACTLCACARSGGTSLMPVIQIMKTGNDRTECIEKQSTQRSSAAYTVPNRTYPPHTFYSPGPGDTCIAGSYHRGSFEYLARFLYVTASIRLPVWG